MCIGDLWHLVFYCTLGINIYFQLLDGELLITFTCYNRRAYQKAELLRLPAPVLNQDWVLSSQMTGTA